MTRLVGSLVVGALAALAAIFLIQRLGHLAWPLPSDLDLEDPEAAARMLGEVPLGAKLVVVFGWFAGGLIGAAAAGRMSRRSWPGWAVAALASLAGIVTVMLVPQPVWMQISAVAAPLLGGLVAHHLPTRDRKGANDG